MTDKPTTAKQLRCPFCGQDTTGYRRLPHNRAYVKCSTCGAQGPPAKIAPASPTMGAVIAAWNRRNPSAPEVA